jgi:heme a synthase
MQEMQNKPFFLLTVSALVLGILMSVLSAYIRHADSGIGCDPWPTCFGVGVIIDTAPGITILATDSHPGLRSLHRLVASVFGLIILVMAVVTLWYRRRFVVGPGWPMIALIVTIVLALVGMNTPNVHRPLIALTNLAGGMVLAAVLYHLVLIQLRPPTQGRNAATLTSVGALVVTLIVIASGAWVSGTFATGSCNAALSCDRPPLHDIIDAFDPMRELLIENNNVEPQPADAWTLYLHQALAPLVAFFILGCLSAVGITRGFAPWMLVAPLAILAMLLLTLMEWSRPAVLTATLHNALALTLLLALVYQLNVVRR